MITKSPFFRSKKTTQNIMADVLIALLIGIITGLLRYAFALPGGIGVAILVGNLLAPIIDLITTPRVFGHRGRTFPINSTFRR